MELGLVFRNTLSHMSHFLSRIFISHVAFFISHVAFLSRMSHFYLAFLSHISHFYLACRIFISHFYLTSRIFISHLAFLSRIFISHLAFLSRISHFIILHLAFFISHLASRISHFYLAFNSRIFSSSFIKSHLECPLQASVITIWERKENPSMNFLMVIMASGIARGRDYAKPRRQQSRATWRPYSK